MAEIEKELRHYLEGAVEPRAALEWSRAFEVGRPRVEVTVRVAEDVRRLLPGEPRLTEDGRAVVAFEHLGEAYRELLRFGADVEVLEPVELRERVAETGRRVASIYSR